MQINALTYKMLVHLRLLALVIVVRLDWKQAARCKSDEIVLLFDVYIGCSASEAAAGRAGAGHGQATRVGTRRLQS